MENIVESIVVFWLISAFSHAMPEPEENGSRWYLFIYRFLHYLVANLDKARRGNGQKP